MNNKKYCLEEKNGDYVVKKLDVLCDSLNSENTFDTLQELFVYLFDTSNTLSFFDIFKIFTASNIDYNKCDLLKYYISNSKDIQNSSEEIYIKVKINKGYIYEILSILPKSLSSKKVVKGASLTLKISKQYIPFYMSIFVKDYTIEDYYPTLKDIFGDSRIIPFIDLYSYSGEYYVVKNRDKVVYISINKEMAMYYVDLISSIRRDSSLYFVPNVELILGFKNLVNYLKIQDSSISVNNIKNIVDFRGVYNNLNFINQESEYLISGHSRSYIVKTKENDYILKDNIDDMYDFVVQNKVHSPEIMEISEMKRVVSKREVFKSIFLGNVINDDEILYHLNGISILEDDNLIRIYSNLVSIILKDKEYNPVMAIVLNKEDSMSYDVLFFFSENDMIEYIDSTDGKLEVLNFRYISLEYVKNKMIEKNLEILMNDRDSFNSDDIVLNLTHLYSSKEKTTPKVKKLSEMQCIIDVDSSLDDGVASCGIVLRDSYNRILGKISRKLNAKTSVEAEIRGAMHAIKYATMENFTEICLRYDYIGIFEYLISPPNTEISKEYQEFFKDIVNKHDIDIYFKKVKAHSSDEYNELADYLAGNLNVNESFLK